MNILNKLTIRNLKLNKKRTVVTIIGIVLSVALISAICCMFFSARDSLIDYQKSTNGNYHYVFSKVPSSDLDNFELNRKIEKVCIVGNMGYAKYDSIKNKDKPYICVKAYSKESMENLGVNLMEGRFPQSEDEIVLPIHLKNNGKVEFQVGDTIALDIGTRVLDGTKLNETNPYSDGEKIINSIKREYKVVGIMERLKYSMESYETPGYTAITHLNNDKIMEDFSVYVRYNKEGLSEDRKVTADILGISEEDYSSYQDRKYYLMSDDERNTVMEKMQSCKYTVDCNDGLLFCESSISNNPDLNALVMVCVFVVVIIMLATIFSIKNSFNISICEKVKQYGMLSSVGATKKQIKKNVYYEAFVLAAIGIPVGLLLGVLVSNILVIITNILLDGLVGFKLHFTFSWMAMILTILAAIITIFLSSLQGAIKAGKITPIEAITNNEEIKIKAKKLKVPKLITKLFNCSGNISYKNLKRSKKKYRTTISCLVICVSVFIALSTFMNLAFRMIDKELTIHDYSIAFSYKNNEHENTTEKVSQIRELEDVKEVVKERDAYLFMDSINSTQEYREDMGENNSNHILNTIVMDKDSFMSYAKKLGIKDENCIKEGILFNTTTVYVHEENSNEVGIKDIKAYEYNEGDTLKAKIYLSNEDKNKDFSIKLCKTTDVGPIGMNVDYKIPALVVCDEYADELCGEDSSESIIIDCDNAEEVETQVKEIYNNTIDNITNISKENESTKNMYLLICIFMYGLVIVIALIGVTSIFNTVNTNMNLRQREFATLKSIGMTKKEFNKMITLESVFVGTKALIISLPIGLVLSYGVYKMLMTGFYKVGYYLPIIPMIICIIFVYGLILAIMKYSISKINKQNIIETIRNENI